MKQILFLLFTFCGICAVHAQDSVLIHRADSVRRPSASARLLTNPARNTLEIEVKGFSPGELEILMADNRGHRVRDDRRLLFSGDEMIVVMFALPAGIYFVTLKQKEKLVSRHFLVQ